MFIENAPQREDILFNFYRDLLKGLADDDQKSWPTLEKNQDKKENLSIPDEDSNDPEQYEFENSDAPDEQPILDDETFNLLPKTKSKALEDRQSELKTVSSSPARFYVTENEQLLLQGKIDAGQVVETNPRLQAQLEILRSLPEGTVVNTAKNLKVEFENVEGERKTVFQTDANGLIVTNISQPAPVERGSEIVKQNLMEMSKENGLQAEVAFLRESLVRAEERMMTRLEELGKQQTQFLFLQRKKELNNPNWWQNFLNRPSELLKQWQDSKKQQEAATTIQKIFQRETYEGDRFYEGKSYSIVQLESVGDIKRYSVKDHQEQEIFRFNVSPSGVKEIEIDRLTKENLQDLRESRIALQKNQSFTGAFSSLSTQTIAKHARTEQMARGLLALSRNEGFKAQGEHYDLNIQPNGEIQINAKDGRGTIYSRQRQGNDVMILNRMNSNDLSHFEQQMTKVKTIVSPSISDLAKTTGQSLRR